MYIPQASKDDGQKFEVPLSIAKISSFVSDSLEPEDDGDDPPATVELPVPNVTAEVLEKVVAFMKKYHEEPMKPIQTPLRSNSLSDLVQEWYSEFVKVPRNLLFDMVAAANFMDIKPLLDLTCLATSILIKGKRYVWCV